MYNNIARSKLLIGLREIAQFVMMYNNIARSKLLIGLEKLRVFDECTITAQVNLPVDVAS